METVDILGIAGSLRQASYNCAALRAAKSLRLEGSQPEIFELEFKPKRVDI
jgi:NAD(P)H-dependent FMN reductase